MPFDNDSLEVTQVEHTSGTNPFTYASLDLIAGGPTHQEQLVVEFEFTVDRDGNNLSDLLLTMNDKKSIFILPESKWTCNEETNAITVDTDLSDLTPFMSENAVTEVEYPDINLATEGQVLRIKRRTVSNEKLVVHTTGGISASRINRSDDQWISLLQEILYDMEHRVLWKEHLNAADGPIAFENFEIPDGALNIELDDLVDVYCPAKTDGYVVKWVASNDRFELAPDLTADDGGALVAPGGDEDDILTKQSAVDGDVVWISLQTHPSFAGLVANVTTLGTTISNKVSKTGDTMSGPLFLAADPTIALQAATKQYVDNSIATPAAPPINFILNPWAFWDQRGPDGGSGAVLSQGDFDDNCMVYGPDRWGSFFSNSHGSPGTRTVEITQESSLIVPTSIPTNRFIRLACSTGTVLNFNTDAIVKFGQRIEGTRVVSLREADIGNTGSTTTQHISGYIRASQTGDLCVCVRLFNLGATYSANYVTTINIAASNTWQSFSIALPALVNSTWYNSGVANGIENRERSLGAELWFVLRAGSYYNASSTNTWIADGSPTVSPQQQWATSATNFFTSGTTVDVTGVQWTTGDSRQTLQYSPDSEIFQLRRFFQTSSHSLGTAADLACPVTNEALVSSSLMVHAILNPPMANTPTVSIYNPQTGTIDSIRFEDGFSNLNETVSGIGNVSSTCWREIEIGGTPPAGVGEWSYHWAAAADIV